MYPRVVDTKKGQDTSAGTTRTFALPTPVHSGDLLVLWLCCNATKTDTDTTAMTITSSGWTTLLANQANVHFPDLVIWARTTVAYKIAAGGETGVTITTNSSQKVGYIAQRITGHSLGTPPESSAFTQGDNIAALTPSWGAEDTLWIAGATGSPGDAYSTTPPANYGFMVEVHSTADVPNVAVATRNLTASSDDPNFFDATAGRMTGTALVGVRPASTGGASPRFSGGAGNATANLSVGGAESTQEIPVDPDQSGLFSSVSGVQALNGSDFYRLVYVHNGGTDPAATVAWIPQQLPNAPQIAIGAATESAGSTVSAVADEHTAPVGVSFSAPSTSGAGVSLGTIPAGSFKGLWVRLRVPAGTPELASNPGQIASLLSPV